MYGRRCKRLSRKTKMLVGERRFKETEVEYYLVPANRVSLFGGSLAPGYSGFIGSVLGGMPL
jgi:hypothetical protein